MDRKTLEEAIAHAKTIRETAIANAMKKLEETFSPELRATLAKKLEEMELEEEEKEVNEDALSEYDMDLDEEELNEAEEDVAEIEKVTEEEAEEEGEEEDIEVEDEDADIDLENMSEEDLESYIEDVIKDMIESGELEAGENFSSEEMGDEEMEDEEMDINEEMDIDEEMDLDEEINIDEEMDMELEEEDSIEEELRQIFAEENKAEIKMLKSKINSLLEENKFYKKSLEEIKKDITEVKVLNSKLSAINEITSTKQLNKTQQIKLIEAFEKANSEKDVNLIKETIIENLTFTSKKPLRENKGFASATIGGMNRKPIIENNNPFDRWEVIAGLK